MDNKARLTGYGLAISILGALLLLLRLLQTDIFTPHNYLNVSFPQIGTLMKDDPVESRGVKIGRVVRIEADKGVAVAVLELFRRLPIPEDSRFINYNYSLFGARMVVVEPGESPQSMDQSRLQAGEFSNGLAETIHRVDELLTLAQKYRDVSERLQGGKNGVSVASLIVKRLYPAVEDINRFSQELDRLQAQTNAEIVRLDKAGSQLYGISRSAGKQTDTLMAKASQTLQQLSRLSAQSSELLAGMDRMLRNSQDTSGVAGQLLFRRQMYDQTLRLTHNLQTILTLLKQSGVDVIHWRNIHFW